MGRFAKAAPIVMSYKAHIVHHIDGKRMRVRVPGKRHDGAYFQTVQDRLHAIDGVAAQVDPTAASVLIQYDGPFAELCEKMADVGLTELLDLELGPAAELTEAFPPMAKIALLIGVLVFGGSIWMET